MTAATCWFPLHVALVLLLVSAAHADSLGEAKVKYWLNQIAEESRPVQLCQITRDGQFWRGEGPGSEFALMLTCEQWRETVLRTAAPGGDVTAFLCWTMDPCTVGR